VETKLPASTRHPVGIRGRGTEAVRLEIKKAGILKIQVLAVLSLCVSLIASGGSLPGAPKNRPAADTVVLPESVPDPIEPFTGCVGFQCGLMTDVVKPTSRVYRFVVVNPSAPARKYWPEPHLSRTIDQQLAPRKMARRAG